MKKQTNNSKNNTQPALAKTWKVIAFKEIQYGSINFIDLMRWVMDNVPKGTPLSDVKIEFDIDQNVGFYDEIIMKANMNLSVLMY